jgi:hypothetical protein
MIHKLERSSWIAVIGEVRVAGSDLVLSSIQSRFCIPEPKQIGFNFEHPGSSNPMVEFVGSTLSCVYS